MRTLAIAHMIITVITLVVVLGFVFLVASGNFEIRKHEPVLAAQAPVAQPKNVRAPEREGPKGRLIVLRAAKAMNVEFPIFEGENIIGRADQKAVDIDIEDLEPVGRVWSSKQHATITATNGALTIEDLNSANGTYV